MPAPPPRLASILLLLLNQRPLHANQLEYAWHHDIEPFQQVLLALLYAPEHRLRTQPVERLESVSQLSARHARAPRAIVVVCVPDRPSSRSRRALVVLL